MKRFNDMIVLLFAVGFLMVCIEGCGDRERTLGPTEYQERSLLTTSVGDRREILEENSILIVIPKTGEKKELRDPWISGAVLSILPEETRIRLFADGSVYVDDVEIAGMIVAIAGMETFDLSGGILLASWGCAECCYANPPCCTPCPACCDKDKDMYFHRMMEF